MINKAARLITRHMADKNVIQEQYIAVYEYGMRKLITEVMFIGFVILLGGLADKLVFSASFYISVSLIRTFVDGYHAPSGLSCLILSCITFVAGIIYAEHVLPGLSYEMLMMTLGTLCAVFLFQRLNVEDRNQPESDGQGVRKNMNRELLAFTTCLGVQLLSRLLHAHDIEYGIFLAVWLTGLLYFAGAVRVESMESSN